eukprot:sb/3478509/
MILNEALYAMLHSVHLFLMVTICSPSIFLSFDLPLSLSFALFLYLYLSLSPSITRHNPRYYTHPKLSHNDDSLFLALTIRNPQYNTSNPKCNTPNPQSTR